jgi:hypothetical protein
MMNKLGQTPTSEADKQTQPMPGEVDPKDARQKAVAFAAMERLRIKSATGKPTDRKK